MTSKVRANIHLHELFRKEMKKEGNEREGKDDEERERERKKSGIDKK